MPELNFNELLVSDDIEWPKRGRKIQPLPQGLIDALTVSYNSGKTITMVIKSDQIKTLGNTLSKAGGRLNMRVERLIEEDKPATGLATFHFRAKAKNSNRTID